MTAIARTNILKDAIRNGYLHHPKKPRTKTCVGQGLKTLWSISGRFVAPHGNTKPNIFLQGTDWVLSLLLCIGDKCQEGCCTNFSNPTSPYAISNPLAAPLGNVDPQQSCALCVIQSDQTACCHPNHIREKFHDTPPGRCQDGITQC